MSTRSTYRLAAFALLAGASPSDLAAQSIRGRVLLEDSTTAVAGATITVRNAAGTTVGQVSTSPSGRYALTLPRAGAYVLAAIRIGYRPTNVLLGELAASESRDIDLIMHEQPFALAAIGVTAQDRCRMNRNERERFVELWQRARAALGSHVSAAEAAHMVQVITVIGTEDGPQRLPRGDLIWNSNNRSPEIDSLGAREEWTASFFARTPPQVLVARGYAHVDPAGAVEYDVPNPEVVLSERFLSHYCFRLGGGPSDHRDWIGLRFQPIADVDSLTDIAGTLWLDPTTAQLQRLEFEYRNLPRIPFATCTANNRPQRTPYGERRYGPYCYEYRNRGAIRLPQPPEGTGGTLQFAAIGKNEWMLTEWTLRTPGQEFMDRPTGEGMRVEGGESVKCYDRPPSCLRVLVAVPRLIVTSGAVIALTRNGEELYRSEAALAALGRIATSQAHPRPGHVAGVVTDTDGRPIPRAVISTYSPARAAMTDSTGRFELRAVPARELAFEVVRVGFQPLAFRLQIHADSTRRVLVELLSAALAPLVGPRVP